LTLRQQEGITVPLRVEVLVLFVYIQSENVNVNSGADYIYK